MRELVVIGASWGGLEAVGRLLAPMPADFETPIVVVQHRSPDSRGGALEQVIANRSPLRVSEVDDKSAIEPGVVYVAPADYHLHVDRGHFSLDVDERVQYSRPSIDVAFSSAADTYGDRLVAVLLTGNNEDGAAGMVRVRACGGLTVAQDPASAEKPAMPQSAIDTGAVMKVLTLEEMPRFLVAACMRERAA